MSKSLYRGMFGYLQGAKWLWAHPLLLALSGIPFLAAMIGMVAGIMFLFPFLYSWSTTGLLPWLSGLLGGSDFWVWNALLWIFKGFLLISVFLLSLIGAMILMVAFTSPINEYISMRVERDMLGEDLQPQSWGRLIRIFPRVMAGEFLKALLILIVPLAMMLIPGVNLFAGFVAVFLIGWDFYDFPLVRRNWLFTERFKFAMGEFWSIFGFGLWLAIPVVHIFLIPLAVAGGTILNLQALSQKGLVSIRPTWLPGPGDKSQSLA